MEMNFKPYIPPGSPAQYGFAGTSLDYPGRSAGFMQAAPEPPCIKKAADGTCQLNVYQAALLGGVFLAIGLAIVAGGSDNPESSLPGETFFNY